MNDPHAARIEPYIKDDRKWVRRLLPVLIVIAGIVITVAIVKSKKKLERKKTITHGLLVKTLRARRVPRRVVVRGHGTVQAQRKLIVSPEVSGKVRWANPQLIVGGLLKKGAVLLRIDPVDYRLATQRARAQIAQARRSLAEAESNSTIARREWKILGKQTGRKATPLTLGEPQLEQAKALMASAKADLRLAQVRLARTVIRAPFDLRVSKEIVEVGQYVTPGMQLATVFGTARAEVIVPLQVSDLRWIDVPKLRFGKRGVVKKGSVGASAWVSLKVGNKTYKRRGRLERTIGEIDPTGRLTRIVVSIEDPYNLRAPAPAGYQPDFQIGSFVEVEIEGRNLGNVIPIPAEALRIGSTVWILDEHSKLEVRKVDVVHLTASEALIGKGLSKDDEIVMTPIGHAVSGLRLRRLPATSAGQPKPRASLRRERGAR